MSPPNHRYYREPHQVLLDTLKNKKHTYLFHQTEANATPEQQAFQLNLIQAAFSGGQPKKGCDQGPSYLLNYGLADQLTALGWNVGHKYMKAHLQTPDSHPPTYTHPKLKNVEYVSRVCEELHHLVKDTCKEGKIAVTVGGDHSLAMGTISGSKAVYGDRLGIVWVDAHADINTPDTTSSGNMHGMPVAFLMGLCGQIQGYEWLSKCLDFQSIVYIGLRDVDAPEKEILRQHGIKAFGMHDVDKYGIGKIMEMALDYIGRDRPLHLSFDVDALDPSVAPSTGTPVRGGLTFREGHFICETLWETGNLVAVDLMEVNPALGDQAMLEETVKVGCSLVRASLGETLL